MSSPITPSGSFIQAPCVCCLVLWVTGLLTVLMVVQVTAEIISNCCCCLFVCLFFTQEQIERETTTNILSLIIAQKIYFSIELHGILLERRWEGGTGLHDGSTIDTFPSILPSIVERVEGIARELDDSAKRKT